MVENIGKQDAIDDKHYIVANQHGRHKAVRMPVEKRYKPLRNAMLLLVHLRQHSVAGNERNLHAREKGTQDHRYEDFYNL